MAKEEKIKIVLERTYNVPLRKGFQKAPKYKRAKKAVNTVKAFLKRHMKAEVVKVGKYLNQKIWEKGIKSPPHHVKVVAKKDSDGIVTAELADAPVEKKKEEKKAAKKGEKATKKEEPKAGKPKGKPEAKPEEKKEAKPEARKEISQKLTEEEKRKMDAKGTSVAKVPKAEELAKKK